MTERALLEVRELRASYGGVEVVHGVDLQIAAGEVVVLLGANGAGKTTVLRAISGMVSTSGSVRLAGRELVGTSPADILRAGIAHVPQGRGTFAELTVEENLRLGAYSRNDAHVGADIDDWCGVFPVLGHRRAQVAGSLSGGEQQMLAVARALMSRPQVVLLDEPSLGLAPRIVEELFARFAVLTERTGTTLLLVEQNAHLALGLADRGHVLEAGEIVLSGTAAELAVDDEVRRAYLGGRAMR